MRKITSPGYSLPAVLAMRASYQTEGGANKPLVIKGVDIGTGASGEYVLKYRGAERMDNSACGRELLAAFLAAELEIQVPEPAVIQVNDHFIESLLGSSEYSKISKSKGINFGCVFVEGNVPVVYEKQFSLELEKQAARIFAFDVLLKHSDRNARKPNMFIAKEVFHVIDHELAFGFLFTLPFLLNPIPWELNEVDVNDAKNHFFYPILKGNRRIDWESVFATFENINESFWARAIEWLPGEWNDPAQTNQIRHQITQVISHLNEFKSEIWTKLIMP